MGPRVLRVRNSDRGGSCEGPTRTAEGRRVGCVRVRVLVSSVSGRMAYGLSPRGVASFVHARSGAPDDQPGPCPPTCSRPPVVPHVPSPRRVEIAFLAGFVVLSLYWRCRATSHGG